MPILNRNWNVLYSDLGVKPHFINNTYFNNKNHVHLDLGKVDRGVSCRGWCVVVTRTSPESAALVVTDWGDSELEMLPLYFLWEEEESHKNKRL